MSMDIFTCGQGSKVLFTGKGGYDHENQYAHARLKVGQVLTVKSLDIGNWKTFVEFEEVEGAFNSVLFDEFEEFKTEETTDEGMGIIECPSDCCGCSCHLNPPCSHCTDGHGLEAE